MRIYNKLVLLICSSEYSGSVSCYLKCTSSKDGIRYYGGNLTITMPDGVKVNLGLSGNSIGGVGANVFNVSQNFSGSLE